MKNDSKILSFKKLFIVNGFTKEDLSFIEEEKNKFNENYFEGINFYDNETLIVYRTLALPKNLSNKFISLDKKSIGSGIGEYWTLNKKLASAVWGHGHYENEETFDTMCIGHLKIKDIDWERMIYAFNDDAYHFTSESEIRGKKGGDSIKLVSCHLVEDIFKKGGNVGNNFEYSIGGL